MFYNIKIKKKKYKIEKFRKIKKSIKRINIKNREEFTYLYIYNLYITENRVIDMYTTTI